MSKIKVLFFAADPLSAPAHGHPRLMLDEDVRRIREKVRAAEHRDALDFDFRLAARTDDLVQALNETRPRVVHFSGHGGQEGLVLVSADGRHARTVGADALARVFTVFRGDIGVVVLNACFSLPQARAIAEAVGCAIGTRQAIPDEAAITFGASFYRAIAFGHSVLTAFDQASTAMALEHPEAQDCTELVVRADVDASALVLVPPQPHAAPPGEADPLRPPASSVEQSGPGRKARWAVSAAIAIALSSGGAALATTLRGGGTSGPPPVNALGSFAVADSARAGAGLGWEAAEELYETRRYAAAFPAIERAARAGNPEAMGILGIMYLKGLGTARQAELGVDWLKKAAEKRDARGMNARGEAFEEGNGFRVNYYHAMRWYRAAATEKGYAPAMINLGDLYREGLGRRIDYDSALTWYHTAIDSGSTEAMVVAGRLYEEGPPRIRNSGKALSLYRSAADAGSPLGMDAMGRAYQQGVIVPRDYAQARAWYQKGAEAGSADAMNNLGVLYHNGWGVPENRDEAARWYRRAAAAGSPHAPGNLTALQPG